jgi:hypothetical protein
MADFPMIGGNEETPDHSGIETMAGMAVENEDGTVDINLGDDQSGVTENEDGSVDITVDQQEDAEVAAFYANLVPQLLENENNRQMLNDIALDLINKIDDDVQARAPRDKQYAEGIKRTGFSNDAPGGAQFQGASRVAHPMIAQAAVDYQARVMKEIFPATGPVKAHIVGTTTRRRQEKATRVARCLNWQLTEQMKEFRTGLERGEMQASLNGSAYLHWIPIDPILRRTTVQLVNIDKVIIAAEANDFYSAERITILDDITEMTYQSRVDQGIYFEDGLASVAPSQAPDATLAEKAREKVEGKTETVKNEDGVRRIFVVNVWLQDVEAALEGSPFEGETGYMPYLVYICEETQRVLGVIRNWEEDDTTFQRMHWLTELPFVPWEESNIGLVHLIGGLAAATTGALRALLDSAHVNNIPTAVILKGSGIGGQSKTLSPTQIYELEGGVGADDLRKLMMPIPYNEPSSVLYQLMTFLVDSGEGVVRTTFEKLSENNTNLPVGTTYALLEQGLTVVSSIMARQHYAMRRAFETLFRINRMYLSDQEIKNEAGEILAYRSDFNGPMDVVPVSDPNIPSDSHRMAQTQALAQRADSKPQLYNAREVERQVLQQLKIADPDRFLAPEQRAVEMNAANENMAAALGRPIVAMPEQDHLAHLQVHLEFMQSPMFGFLPIIAPGFLPVILQHIKEHLVLYYVSKVFEGLQTSVQASKGPLAAMSEGGTDIVDFMKMNNSDVNVEMDKLLAVVSSDVLDAAGPDMRDLLQLQVIQAVQKAQQVLQQYAPPPVMDPSQAAIQKATLDNQTRREATQARKEEKVADIQARRETTQAADIRSQRQLMLGKENIEAQDRREQLKVMATNERESEKQQAENQRLETRVAADLQMNEDDNQTAMVISAAEIETGEKVARSTGGDSSPGI